MPIPDGIVPLWINGEWKTASNDETFNVINPQTNEVASISASASSEDCSSAILAASASLDSWEQVSPAAKRDIFLRAASLTAAEKYRDRIIESNISETAATQLWASAGVMSSSRTLQHAANLTGRLKGETWPSTISGGTALVQRRPIGVVLAIAPWNGPTTLSMRAICSPLACGNTVVLKTSDCCPKSQVLVAEILHEAGLPPGVLNVVSTSRANAAKMTSEMIAHPLVRKLNFTGSDTVGRLIAIEAAKHLKPCVLELGGKAPAVVLADADVDAASRAIIHGAMMNSGQVCMSTERVVVQCSVAAVLTTALVRVASKLKAGDPSKDPSAQLGCLTDASAQAVVSLLKEAESQGAEFLVGDGMCNGPFVQPHLVKGVRPGMRLWERESFGPIVAITEVDTVDEAVELANATTYSLTASLWTRDILTGINIANRIQAGVVMINGVTFHSEPEFPIRGLGGTSGYGSFDIEDWTHKRMIMLQSPNQKYPLVD